MNRRLTAHYFTLGTLLSVTGMLLLAAWLRLDVATREARFHPDEALYATFARDAVTYGDWWLPGALDKPPVSLYASALAMHFFASEVTPHDLIEVPFVKGEFAARLPNLWAGILLVAILYTTAKSIIGHHAALLAAFLVAISPHAVGFSASGFTDMLMLTLSMGAVLAMQRGKPVTSGLLMALSIATKPQGAFFLVWALWLPFVAVRRPRPELGRFAVALLTGVALLFIWDALRPGESFLSAGNRHINPGRLFSTPAEWGARLRLWLDYGMGLFGPAWLTAGLVVTGFIMALRGRAYVALLAGFVIGYSILHVISALPLFDRYLVLVVPPLAIVIARGLVSLAEVIRLPQIAVYAAILLVTLPVIPYDTGQYGRRPGDILAIAHAINTREPGAILYDHWLGWEMGYYLGAWHDKRRVYYPTPADLQADSPRNPDHAPRYLVAPADEHFTIWLDAARAAGFSVRLAISVPGFALYRLTTPAADALDAGSS